MEVARVEIRVAALGAGHADRRGLRARFELASDVLRLEIVGDRTLEVALDGLDFFDLGNSPLFNSLPVLRDGLLEAAQRATT